MHNLSTFHANHVINYAYSAFSVSSYTYKLNCKKPVKRKNLPHFADLLYAYTAFRHKEKSVDLHQRILQQGQKDSNPQQRFWRPTCYHYTMPLLHSQQWHYMKKHTTLSRNFLFLICLFLLACFPFLLYTFYTHSLR